MSATDVTTMILKLDALKSQRAKLDAEITDLQAEVMSVMDDKSVAVELPDRIITTTKVQSVRTVINEPALKRALGQKYWMRVSSRMLDKAKLQAQMATGDIDPLVVAECTVEKPSKAYLKIT